jgi:hypothetical protein
MHYIIANKMNAYIHCTAGIGRSGSFAVILELLKNTKLIALIKSITEVEGPDLIFDNIFNLVTQTIYSMRKKRTIVWTEAQIFGIIWHLFLYANLPNEILITDSKQALLSPNTPFLSSSQFCINPSTEDMQVFKQKVDFLRHNLGLGILYQQFFSPERLDTIATTNENIPQDNYLQSNINIKYAAAMGGIALLGFFALKYLQQEENDITSQLSSNQNSIIPEQT